MRKEKAIVLTNGLLETEFAKSCHGLLRGSDRYEVLALVDNIHAGMDAGEALDGRHRGIPIYASVEEYFAQAAEYPAWCVVGVAIVGGQLPDDFRQDIANAIKRGLSVVCGLHTLLNEDPQFSQLARENGVQLLDIRQPRPAKELRFWTGEIYEVASPKIAVLGMDCAVGKRTTCRFLMEICQQHGIKTEMIYTGQTGWMQGYKYGFIFDATLNDFIGGEIEKAILNCYRNEKPDLILIEGQSGLRVPAGPAGSEFLICGNVKGVVLQHIPGRKYYEDTRIPLKDIETEIKLIELYGAELLGVTLNGEGLDSEEMLRYRDKLQRELPYPVVLPMEEGVERLLPIVRDFMERSTVDHGNGFGG